MAEASGFAFILPAMANVSMESSDEQHCVEKDASTFKRPSAIEVLKNLQFEGIFDPVKKSGTATRHGQTGRSGDRALQPISCGPA